MKTYDFVIVGSGGGGGTISWLLAKAGFSVALLEQGPDLHKELEQTGDQAGEAYNAEVHDEYRFRLRKPRLQRRPRGAYNTRREVEPRTNSTFFQDLMGGWTGSTLGGGTVIWGTWGLRPFPLDFKLATFFKALEKEKIRGDMDDRYSLVDWPIPYSEMVPFFNVAEALLAVSGNRDDVFESVRQSAWFNALKGFDGFGDEKDYRPEMDYPLPSYPRTPVGHLVYEGAKAAGMVPCDLPVSIVNPRSGPYQTRAAIAKALAQWGPRRRAGFWQQQAKELWSERIRTACTMCGFCGEYLCWGKDGPKSGTRVSTIPEFQDLPNTRTICNARAYEVLYDERKQRATGVAYLDVNNPDDPRREVLSAKHVIVSCGAVQTARLLLMSGPPGGLGNTSDQLGRNAMFHLFGLGMTVFLKPKYQGLLRSEFGPTGNTATYANYLVNGGGKDTGDKWFKAGIFASTASKNPLENAVGSATGKPPVLGLKLLQQMDLYARRLELRITGDDLPRRENRVELDPNYVDEFGFPVARVARSFGPHEGADETKGMQKVVLEQMTKLFDSYVKKGVIDELRPGKALLDLIGDHQMGTCRMGDDPKQSVLNRHCQMHDVPNVFVVDSSFMPTSFGVNPMVTVVANALRVGTWIIDQSRKGQGLS